MSMTYAVNSSLLSPCSDCQLKRSPIESADKIARNELETSSVVAAQSYVTAPQEHHIKSSNSFPSHFYFNNTVAMDNGTEWLNHNSQPDRRFRQTLHNRNASRNDEIELPEEQDVHQNGFLGFGDEFEMMPTDLETGPGIGEVSQPSEQETDVLENGGDFQSYIQDRDEYQYTTSDSQALQSSDTPVSIGRQLEPIYGYYYIERKLWYLPLYFSIYFVMYIGSLVIKAVSRHRVFFPQTVSAVVP